LRWTLKSARRFSSDLIRTNEMTFPWRDPRLRGNPRGNILGLPHALSASSGINHLGELGAKCRYFAWISGQGRQGSNLRPSVLEIGPSPVGERVREFVPLLFPLPNHLAGGRGAAPDSGYGPA
jgi:hypothetical protein